MIMKKFILAIALSLLLTSSAHAAEFNNNLKYGSKGSDVVKLQEFLNEQGLYNGPITGNFFSLTLKAVKAFQVRESISPASGFFGNLTRSRVNTILDSQLASSESESVNEPVVVESAPVSAEVLRLNELLGAVQAQNTLLQSSLDLQKSEANRLQALQDAETARRNAEDQAKAEQERLLEGVEERIEQRNQQLATEKALQLEQQRIAQSYQPSEIYNKYIKGHLVNINNITDSSVSFFLSGNDGWDGAKVNFYGQTIFNESGVSTSRVFSFNNGSLLSSFTGSEELKSTLCQFCTNWVNIYNLTPNTEYNYQIIYGTGIYTGTFKTL